MTGGELLSRSELVPLPANFPDGAVLAALWKRASQLRAARTLQRAAAARRLAQRMRQIEAAIQESPCNSCFSSFSDEPQSKSASGTAPASELARTRSFG